MEDILKLRNLWVFLFFNAALSVKPQDPIKGPILNLEILLQEVVERNPDLAATRSRIKAAGIAVPRVQILDDPQITVRSINNPFGSKEAPFVPQLRYKASQRFPFPGKLRLQGRIAKQELEFFKTEEVTTHRELILQSKRLYFQLYLNKIAMQINKENKDITSRLIDGALYLYKTGKGSQADVLKGHVELQKLDEELLQLESEQKSLVALINAILNREQLKEVGQPEENFFPYTSLVYEKLEEIAMRNRSEIYGIEARVGEEKARVKLARRNFFPDLTVGLMLQDLPDRSRTAWGIEAGINLPIWVDVRQKREMREAKQKAQSHYESLLGLKASIRGRIKELLAQIKSSEERIDLYKTGLIPKTVETLRSNEARYRSGKGDFLTVLDTRRQFQNFELDYEAIRIEREILLAELERAIGIPIEKVPYFDQRKYRLSYSETSTNSAHAFLKNPISPVRLNKRRSMKQKME